MIATANATIRVKTRGSESKLRCFDPPGALHDVNSSRNCLKSFAGLVVLCSFKKGATNYSTVPLTIQQGHRRDHKNLSHPQYQKSAW